MVESLELHIDDILEDKRPSECQEDHLVVNIDRHQNDPEQILQVQQLPFHLKRSVILNIP